MKPSTIFVALAVTLLAVVAAPVALAQALLGDGGARIVVDPAPYIDAIIHVAGLGALAAFAWVKSKLPRQVAIFLEQRQVDSLLEKALGYGAARVKGAGFSKPVTIDVVNPWLAMALEYLDDRAPDFLRKHGAEALERMLLARMPIAQGEAFVQTRVRAEHDPAIAGFVRPTPA